MIRHNAAAVLAGIAVVAAAVVCVRLGLWQLERLSEKRLRNAEARAALDLPPVPWRGATPGAVSEGRRVVAEGRYDESRHLLLRGQIHDGEPGVVVVTPLRADGGEAVLVERGWLPADDAWTARPQDYAEPGVVQVLGVARRIAKGTRSPGTRRLPGDDPVILSVAALDLDSLVAVFPYSIAGFVIRQLPGPRVPNRPVRLAPKPLDEGLHLGYAVQWFMFAGILVGGWIFFVWSSRKRQRDSRAPAS